MKYENFTNKPLFGDYTDPFKDRRVKGPSRPSHPIPFVEPHFNRDYDSNKLYFSWLGHSSVFISINSLNILVDPIFSTYASPVPIPILKRFNGRRVYAKDFPHIDLVLITHNHYDHMDGKTLRHLQKQVDTFIVPRGVKKYLIIFGVSQNKIMEIEWEQDILYKGLTITSLRSQHGSNRVLIDSNSSQWCSYLIRNDKYKVFDSGDGGFSPYFEEINRIYGKMDLTIMECGQYNERWHGFHMFPEESVLASQILETKLTIPVHYGAFILSNHAWNESPKRFERRAKELNVPYLIPKLYEIIEL